MDLIAISILLLLVLLVRAACRRQNPKPPRLRGPRHFGVSSDYDPAAVDEWLAMRTGDPRHARHLPRAEAQQQRLEALLEETASDPNRRAEELDRARARVRRLFDSGAPAP